MCKVITDYGNFCWQLLFVYLLCPQIKIYCFQTNTQEPKIVCELVNLYVRQNIFVCKKFAVSLFENGIKF